MRLYNDIGEIMTPKQEPSLFGLTNSNRDFKKRTRGEKINSIHHSQLL